MATFRLAATSVFATTIALEAVIGPARVEAQQAQSLTIARYAEWELTEKVNAEGRISYVGTLGEHRDILTRLQIECAPSISGFTFSLFDGTINPAKNESVLVTFNNYRTEALDQFEARGTRGRVSLLGPLFLELVGCGRCNPPTAPQDRPLFLSVLGRTMEFNPSGIRDLWEEMARRCHL